MKLHKTTALFVLILFSAVTLGQNNTQGQSKTKPFVLGVIDGIHSKILNENRILNIYLPDGYTQNDTISYPVIYLLDGSADEDFIHITGLVQYNSFEWINRVPKSIVVGIATVDRRRDFTFPTTIKEDQKAYPTTGHSEQFINFIATELQPYIERNYKTNKTKTLIGQSLGGLLATEILLKKPNLFNKYVIISPSLWWDNGSLLNLDSKILDGSFSQPTTVCIAVGKEGLTPTTIPRIMEDDAKLLVNKIKASKSKNLTVLFDFLPEEDHATIMHQAVANAFKHLYSTDGKQ